MRIETIEGMPQEEGFYFARRKGKNYWECIIRVGGKAPFLNCYYECSLFKTTDSIKNNLSDCIFSEKMELEKVN